MRPRLALAALTLFAAHPSIGTAQAADDWVLVKVTAGSLGAARVHLSVKVTGTVPGDGPLVTGTGTGYGVRVNSRGGDGLTFRSTGPVSGSTRILSGEPQRFEETESISGFELLPGEAEAVLVFVANAAFDSVTVDHGAQIGSVTVEERRGGGSTAMLVAAQDNGETAVSAGPVAAGSSSFRARVARGLVGAMELSCEACAGQWTAPDGRSRLWIKGASTSIRIGGVATPQFAGPAGDWSWSWTGSADPYLSLFNPGSAVMGAWAPIGDDWEMFRGSN